MVQDREVISRLPSFAKLCDNASDVASFAERFTAEIFECGRGLAQKV
jgi:hypothetical protein